MLVSNLAPTAPGDESRARRVVAITGASSGIGAAFARRLAWEHDLLLIARRKERLELLARELHANCNCQAEILVADLSQEPDVYAIANRLRNEPRLSLLINNAGFGTSGYFWQTPLTASERMHELHVMATLRLTHAAVANLIERNVGGIINVASMAAFVRSPGSVSYCATKAWMTAFTEGLYLEMKSTQSAIRIQMLCPGFTYSEFHYAMGVERTSMAGTGFWHSAEFVVDRSLAALERNTLLVIPGWRYRLFMSAFAKLPYRVQLKIEELGGQIRQQRALNNKREPSLSSAAKE